MDEWGIDAGRTATQAPAGADVEIGSRGCEGVEPVESCSIHISQTKDDRCDAAVGHDAVSLRVAVSGASVECQGLSDAGESGIADADGAFENARRAQREPMNSKCVLVAGWGASGLVR